jgi:hypothetical protein
MNLFGKRLLTLAGLSILLACSTPAGLHASSLNIGYFFVTGVQTGVIDAFSVQNATGVFVDPIDGFPVTTPLVFIDPTFELFFASGATQTTSPDVPYSPGLWTSTFEFSDSLQLTKVLFFATLPANTTVELSNGTFWNLDTSITGTLLPAGTYIDPNDFGLITVNANPAGVPEPAPLIGILAGLITIVTMFRPRFARIHG